MYIRKIYERYNDLLKSGKKKDDMTNNDLWKIFEYFTCIKLTQIYKKQFYEYEDIDPSYKEENYMTQNDTGIDACDLDNTVVQCKLRQKSLTWSDCATFFGSQLMFDEQKQETIVRWNNRIIVRNDDCTLSSALRIKQKLFEDVTFSRDQIINFCENLIKNPPKYPVERKENLVLRDYQIDAIDLIKTSQKNVIINLPTGTGKNIIIIKSMLAYKRYLILVPRIILMEQLKDEIIKYNPRWKKNIQMIGDKNSVYDETKRITLCVFNSVGLIKDYKDTFDKIFVDEAHHVNIPNIYKDDDTEIDENDVDDSVVNDNDNDNDDTELEDMIDEIVIDDNDDNIEDIDDDRVIHMPDKPLFKRITTKTSLDVIPFKKVTIKEDDDIEQIIKTTKSLVTHKKPSVIENPTKKNNKKLIEDNENIESDDEDNITYTDIIKSFLELNNNVYLSATIDQRDGFDFYKKDIREMIDRGYLCDYIIKVPVFSNNPSNKNVCEYLIKNYRNIIVYCNSQKGGRVVTNMFNDIQKNSAEYIDCSTPKRKRNDILKRYKEGKIQFIVNVRILVEGFDSNITTGVCLMNIPSNNKTLIQIIGRALRLHNSKRYAHIILPYSVNDDEKSIKKFLKIVAKNDARIRITYERKQLGGYISIDKIVNDDDNSKTLEEIEFRYEQIYDSLKIAINYGFEYWRNRLVDLKLYIDTYKKLHIDTYKKLPSSKDKNEIIKSLAIWSYDQRSHYKNRNCNMKQQCYYNEWTLFLKSEYGQYLMNYDEKWHVIFKAVQLFIDKNNALPSKYDKDISVAKIGNWINTQLINYKNETHIMKNPSIRKTWENFTCKHKKYFTNIIERWKERKNSLIAYFDRYHTRPVSIGSDKTTVALGKWMINQMGFFKKKSELMKNANVYKEWSELVDIYREYFITDEDKWKTQFSELKKYIDQNDRIPSRRDNTTKSLSYWFTTQNKNFKKHTCIMKNKNISDSWRSFKNDEQYKKYFN